MNKELETLEKLLSFAFVMSENMVGLTKGNYDEKTFVKKTYEYLQKYAVSHSEQLVLQQRLESIDNAKSSKAIESLEEICNDKTIHDYILYNCLDEDIFNIRQSLFKAQKTEKENSKLKGQVNYLTEVVTEFQKMLKIIKEKRVNVDELIECILLCRTDSAALEEYNFKVSLIWNDPNDYLLTEEEFDLLKRYFVS